MVQSPPAQKELYPCPACGFLVFGQPPGSFEMCPICGWEDCPVQLRHPTCPVGPNDALVDWQKSILKRLAPEVREHQGYQRAPDWRPLREDDLEEFDEGPDTGFAYFQAIPEDDEGQDWYYWRKLRSGEGEH